MVPPSHINVWVENLEKEDGVEEQKHDPVEGKCELVSEDCPLVRLVRLIED
jgi:hypothetical protein